MTDAMTDATTGGTRARVLVTNDDGIGSEGLRRLALVAEELGLDVVVAAPMEEASGSSASITAVEEGGRVVVERRTLDGLRGEAFAVAAKPAFISLIASRGAFGPAPDVVLSGINRGVNLGQVILHSGTVGAALTAAQQGARAMAVSAQVGDPMPWDRAAEVARHALRWLLEEGGPLVINVNVPVDGEETRPVIAELDPFGAVQTEITEAGEGSLTVTVISEPNHEPPPGSDVAILASGRPTVTALRPVCEDGSVALDRAFTAPDIVATRQR